MEKVKDELKRTDTVTLLRRVGKNPERSNSGLVKDKESVARDVIPEGEPVLELKGDAWNVEYQSQKKLLELPPTTFRESLVIRNCYGSTIKVDTKVKAVLMDRCVKTNVILSSVVSLMEVIDCEKLKLQVLGSAQSLTIDKSEGIDVFLSKESKGIMIATSKSGTMNVNFPSSETADGEEEVWVERPLPEQYEHRIDDDKVNTQVSSLYSS